MFGKGMTLTLLFVKRGFDERKMETMFVMSFPVRTKISHGMLGKDIDRELLGKMAEQTHLKFPHFLNLVDCQLSKEDYHKILLQLGFIS
jgi:hypothetical protein